MHPLGNEGVQVSTIPTSYIEEQGMIRNVSSLISLCFSQLFTHFAIVFSSLLFLPQRNRLRGGGIRVQERENVCEMPLEKIYLTIVLFRALVFSKPQGKRKENEYGDHKRKAEMSG